MASGDEGVLNVTIRLTVSPETVVPDLLKRYGDALNYSIKKIVKDEALSLSKAHKSLYNELKKLFNLPPDIVKQLEKP